MTRFPSRSAVRQTQRALLLVLSALALTAAPSSAAVTVESSTYPASAYRVAPSDVVAAATIEALVDGRIPADDLSSGVASADGSRVVFQAFGTRPPSGAFSEIWAVRADGTQLARIWVNPSLFYATDEDLRWVDDDTVTWYHASPYLHGSSSNPFWSVSTDSGGDAWAREPSPGFDTLDGRYRVFKSSPTLTSSTAAPIWVTDLMSGTKLPLKTLRQYTDPSWDAICRMPDGSVPPDDLSIEDALRGARPICRFPQASDDDRYADPYYVQRPLRELAPAAEIGALLGGSVDVGRISPGTYSPDGERIAFRIKHAGQEDDAKSGAVWTVRADGSQARQLSRYDSADALLAHDDDAHWLDDDTLVFLTWGSLVREGTDWVQRVTTAPDGTDTWSTVTTRPDAEKGALTVDGRYRVIKNPQLYPASSSTVDVIDLATGVKHLLVTTGTANGRPSRWNSACAIADGMAISVEEALRGPNPSCEFGRTLPTPPPTPGADPTPVPTPMPTASPSASPVVGPTRSPIPVPDGAPTPVPTVVPPSTTTAPVSIVSFAKQLRAARVKGLRLRLSNAGRSAASVKIWLLSSSGTTLASTAVAKLAPGATTITLPRARKLAQRRTAIVIRMAVVDDTGARSVVEREAELR